MINETEKNYLYPTNQAYLILRIAFALLPILAGLDKFFNFLPHVPPNDMVPFNIFGTTATALIVVGVAEVAVGVGVWLKPKIFAYIVMAWLLVLMLRVLFFHSFSDVAVRDFGLALGALALARLSLKYDP